MALFFLEYDLRKHRDYQNLYDELQKFAAVRVLNSLWAFQRVGASCVGLRDHFRSFIDADDGLLVSEVTDWATYNVLAKPPNS